MTGIYSAGEAKAWELLEGRAPEDIVRSAAVTYDRETGSYGIRCFGRQMTLSPATKTLQAREPEGAALLTPFGELFRLSVLWHLVSARELPLSGRLVRPQDIRGGGIFTRGSHVLPLDTLARRYGTERAAFLARGEALGGDVLAIADAAIRLHPLPRIPAIVTLWLDDEEFPARADLLLDSTCELQAPADVLWSLALTTVQALADAPFPPS